MKKHKHYSAWLITDRTEIDTDFAEVAVYVDEIADVDEGERPGDDGDTCEWTSSGYELFHAVTGLRYDEDPNTLAERTTHLLNEEGWQLATDQWHCVAMGLVVTVKPAYAAGDRVSIDSDADNAPLLLGTIADVDDYRVFVDLDNGEKVARPFAWVTPHLD